MGLDNPGDMYVYHAVIGGWTRNSDHDPSGKVVVGISEGLELNNELIMGSFSTPFMTKMTLSSKATLLMILTMIFKVKF